MSGYETYELAMEARQIAKENALAKVDSVTDPDSDQEQDVGPLLQEVYEVLEYAAGKVHLGFLLQLWHELVVGLASTPHTWELAPPAASKFVEALSSGIFTVTYTTRYTVLTQLAEQLVDIEEGATTQIVLQAIFGLEEEMRDDALAQTQLDQVRLDCGARVADLSKALSEIPISALKGVGVPTAIPHFVREQQKDCIKQPTYFATFRNFKQGNVHPPNMYGGEWSNDLNYGVAQVSIPLAWFMNRSNKFPRNKKAEKTKDAAEGIYRGEYFVVDEISRFDTTDELFTDLNANFKPEEKKILLVFIHGFQETQTSALLHCAQIFNDMGLKSHGVPLLLSWPSSGNKTNGTSYVKVTKTYEQKKDKISKKFGEFISQSMQKCGADKVILMGHSMGCRVLSNTLSEIDLAHDVISHVVFGSPDIDLDQYKNAIKPVIDKNKPLLIYASSRDVALMAGGMRSGKQKVGRRPQDIAHENVEVVSTDRCLSGHMDLLRHSDFSNGALLDMVGAVLEKNTPDERKLTSSKGSNQEIYWSF